MKTFLSVFVFAVLAHAANPFAGRWDITITTPKGTSPRWMELAEKGSDLKVRVQPEGGAVRDIGGAKMDGARLLLKLSDEVTWELTADGDKISGTQKSKDEAAKIAGVRAPALKREMPKKWSAAEPLFNRKDLSGWGPIGTNANHWTAKNGELINEERGANLKTTRKFDDFQLHIEVSCTAKCNSGIYLRGRYEIQVGTEDSSDPTHEMGAVYGYLAPAMALQNAWDVWQVFDIALVGRRLSVLRNRIQIHDYVELPGITGGALDSDEGEPGPIFLQGDHSGGLHYRNITISVPEN
jgi:hypothetical protein